MARNGDQSWGARLALFGAPAIAGVAVALVLLGPGAERPVLAARVRGLPVRGSEHLSFRVQTLRHERGLYANVPLDVEVAITKGEATLGRWQGATAHHGFAEAAIDLAAPIADGSVVAVRHGGDVLASATLVLEDALTVTPRAELAPPPLPGAVALAARLVRGFAVPSFPEIFEVALVVPEGDGDVPRLDVKAPGSEVRALSGIERLGCAPGCRYRQRFELTPRAPTLDVDIEATTASGRGSWHGALELRPGVAWLDPAGVAAGEIRLSAPGPRDELFLSVITPEGRSWGAITAMTTDAGGRGRLTLALPALEPRAARLIVSSEAHDPEDGSASWPLFVDGGELEPKRSDKLADGVAAGLAAEAERGRRARRPAWVLVIAALLFELGLLWWQSRRAQVRLAGHLRDSVDGGAIDAERIATPPSRLWLAALAAALALAFAVLAAVAAWA
jgi:hypothetical protein